MRGGGRHKEKKIKAEKKRSVSPVKSEQTRGETKRVIKDSEKEDLIQRLSEWGVCKAIVDQLAEEDDDEVDKKIQWFLEMLPWTQEQHQMIAPVFRWAVDAERDRRRCSEEVEERVTEETRVQSTMSGLEEVTIGRV